jgi:hypothetical protein
MSPMQTNEAFTVKVVEAIATAHQQLAQQLVNQLLAEFAGPLDELEAALDGILESQNQVCVCLSAGLRADALTQCGSARSQTNSELDAQLAQMSESMLRFEAAKMKLATLPTHTPAARRRA